jgi:Fe-S-cluster containining protein
MAEALEIEMTVFERQYVRLVGGRKSLIERPDGDCIFFESQSRRCRIYAARPQQCRTFPFWSSNLKSEKVWKEIGRHCPGCDQGPLFTREAIDAQRRKKEV